MSNRKQKNNIKFNQGFFNYKKSIDELNDEYKVRNRPGMTTRQQIILNKTYYLKKIDL